jgi:hypothetical protein
VRSKREIQRAAALLGRRGGLRRSEQKAHAARQTGRKVGGRKPVESFNLDRDGFRDGKVVILGFRSTGERELQHKGRWYRSRSGRPILAGEDSPALHSADGAPAVDFLERLEPSHDPSLGRVTQMICPGCAKKQFFLFLGLEPGYWEQQAICRDCSR